MKIVLKTKGMHCISCERVIQDALIEIDGIKNAKTDYINEKTEVEFDPEKAGYEPMAWNENKGGFLKRMFGG